MMTMQSLGHMRKVRVSQMADCSGIEGRTHLMVGVVVHFSFVQKAIRKE